MPAEPEALKPIDKTVARLGSVDRAFVAAVLYGLGDLAARIEGVYCSTDPHGRTVVDCWHTFPKGLQVRSLSSGKDYLAVHSVVVTYVDGDSDEPDAVTARAAEYDLAEITGPFSFACFLKTLRSAGIDVGSPEFECVGVCDRILHVSLAWHDQASAQSLQVTGSAAIT